MRPSQGASHIGIPKQFPEPFQTLRPLSMSPRERLSYRARSHDRAVYGPRHSRSLAKRPQLSHEALAGLYGTARVRPGAVPCPSAPSGAGPHKMAVGAILSELPCRGRTEPIETVVRGDKRTGSSTGLELPRSFCAGSKPRGTAGGALRTGSCSPPAGPSQRVDLYDSFPKHQRHKRYGGLPRASATVSLVGRRSPGPTARCSGCNPVSGISTTKSAAHRPAPASSGCRKRRLDPRISAQDAHHGGGAVLAPLRRSRAQNSCLRAVVCLREARFTGGHPHLTCQQAPRLDRSRHHS
jgi:hypothetical protein